MYVLVCHTDAWVFRDELADWCRKGYDCVAAPWIRRPVYDKPIVKQYMNWLANRRIRQGRFCRQQLYGRVGNGGFSLRRVEAFSAACDRYQALLVEQRTPMERGCFLGHCPARIQLPSAGRSPAFRIRHTPCILLCTDRATPAVWLPQLEQAPHVCVLGKNHSMGSPAQTGNTDIITTDRRKRNNRGSQVHRDWLPLFGITVRALHRQDHRAQTKAYMVTWSMPVGTEMISTSGPQL